MYLPKTDVGYYTYKVKTSRTPALRAEAVDPYQFDMPAGWKVRTIAPPRRLPLLARPSTETAACKWRRQLLRRGTVSVGQREGQGDGEAPRAGMCAQSRRVLPQSEAGGRGFASAQR